MELNEILSKFRVETEISEYGNGHINDTYLCDSTPRYILQRINSSVFKNPVQVMENICGVTQHVREKLKASGGNPDRETLTVIPTLDGKSCYKAEDGSYFRMYKFIEDSVSYDIVENPIQLYFAGRAFGKFQKMLDDFPVDRLYDTIPEFHNTPGRIEQLECAVKENKAGRADGVKAEIDFARSYGKYARLIVDAIESGDIPLRVTHNDTKLNNVLFDSETGEDVCVIDLDTVMPGSALYDFGDALRFGASSALEDETELDKVYFDLEKYEQFAKGFLSETADCLTETEKKLLPVSALILTYECGIRFFADYLNGDTYFKTKYETHNLDRARNQFKLVRDIESKLDDMQKITEKYI